MSKEKQCLTEVFKALECSIDRDCYNTYQEGWEKTKQLAEDFLKQDEVGLAHFQMAQFTNGFFAVNFRECNDDILFLEKNITYIESNIVHWITKIESRACCYDKSSYLIHRLKDLLSGHKELKPISGDEFWHCKKIFQSYDDLKNYYDALVALYYGNPERYFQFIKDNFMQFAEV